MIELVTEEELKMALYAVNDAEKRVGKALEQQRAAQQEVGDATAAYQRALIHFRKLEAQIESQKGFLAIPEVRSAYWSVRRRGKSSHAE